MTWVGLQTISLGWLLVFSATSSRCVTKDMLGQRAVRFTNRYWNLLNASVSLQRTKWTTCAQAAREMRGPLGKRSVSPWSYRVDKNLSRIPPEISVAECLCQGCIINQHEDLNLNSVPVFAPLKVLMKTRCHSDPNKYVVRWDFIQVPVACTCVVPKYAE